MSRPSSSSLSARALPHYPFRCVPTGDGRDVGATREPAGGFDAIVTPGGGGKIQTAVDGCREGGSILLCPGTYDVKSEICITHTVHVFGRGLARLKVANCNGVWCMRCDATLDGLRVDRVRQNEKSRKKYCGISLTGGRPRLQNCTVAGAFMFGVEVKRLADPVIVGCRIHDVAGWGVDFTDDGTRGTLLDCDVSGGGEYCVSVRGGASPIVRGNRIRDGVGGVYIKRGGGSGSLCGNEVWGHRDQAVYIYAAAWGLTSNRIRVGSDVGVHVVGASRVRLERNDVLGGLIIERGAGAEVVGNVIRGGRFVGVKVDGPSAASVNVLENDVSGSWFVNGADPTLRGNAIHDADGADGVDGVGVLIAGTGTRGRLLDNAIYRNRRGNVEVQEGASPEIVGNRIHDARYGVVCGGGGGRGVVRRNDVRDYENVGVLLIRGATVEVEDNVIHAGTGTGTGVGIQVDGRDSGGRVRANRVWAERGCGVSVHASVALDVVGNRVRGEIQLAEGARCAVRRNDVHGGIRLRSGASPLVAGNAIHDGRVGVWADGPSTAGRVEGNAVWAHFEAGVRMSNGARPCVVGNLVCGNRVGVRVDGVVAGVGNAFSRNATDVVGGWDDRVVCAMCGAAGTKSACPRCCCHGDPFAPRYCGRTCREAHRGAHRPTCERAVERADDWLHALDALLDLPGCPYGDLTVIAERRRQRELEEELERVCVD